ncbi:MAG: type IV toxin-antitoxin system AbiEi family antitoxin domain-containing protein [Pseudomonadota bacterium]
MSKNRDAADKLFEIVERQQGYFTYKQALAVGYYRDAAHFHTKSGEWLREKRGIYRLAKFPVSDRPDLVLWSLWSADRGGNIQGVYSYQTALSFYEITDANPAKLHMTVPQKFRKFHSPPKGIVLHRAELRGTEIKKQQGYFVTTPLKTLQDMFSSQLMDTNEVKLAAKQAVRLGIMTPDESDKVSDLKHA